MHREILTEKQQEILPLIAQFSRSFGLVGGTAIALHIGHRESIDFDLFTTKPFKSDSVVEKISSSSYSIDHTLVNKLGEFTFLLNDVKITFFHFPFFIPFDKRFEDIVRVPSLLTLSAMKAYALGMRAKWKDYVDLYFILQKYHTLNEIVGETQKLFGTSFNEKIFRTQLSYFKDINYSEEVVFRPGFEVDNETIQNALTEWALS